MVFLEGAGMQTLNGVQATAYCRVRTHDDDFHRARRQREVLSKMVQKAQAAEIGTLNEIMDAVLENISTSFTFAELLSMASQMWDYQLVETMGFPFELCAKDLGKNWVDIPCDLEKNVTELHQKLFDDEGYTSSDTVRSLSGEIVRRTGYGIGDEEILLQTDR